MIVKTPKVSGGDLNKGNLEPADINYVTVKTSHATSLYGVKNFHDQRILFFQL